MKTPETPVKSRVSGVLKGAEKRSKCSKRHPFPRTRNRLIGDEPVRGFESHRLRQGLVVDNPLQAFTFYAGFSPRKNIAPIAAADCSWAEKSR